MKKPICPNTVCLQNTQTPSKIIRYGFFTVHCGRRRRYRCPGCGRTFSRRLGSAYFRLRCSAVVFNRVAQMSVEGMSRAAISRVEGVSWQTADRWLDRACESALAFNDQRLLGVPSIELQVDELKTFSPSKKCSTWMFTTMEVCSRLWLSTKVGRRNFRNTYQVVNDALARTSIAAVPLITSDGFSFYEPVIRRLFGAACVYAQVIKTWRKNRVAKIEQRAVIGSPQQIGRALANSEDSETINTSFIERLNLTLRQSTGYPGRRTTGHSRCIGKLEKHLELTKCYYNFIRQHQSLKFGSELRTPAMIGGIADRVLSFTNIFLTGRQQQLT